MNENVENVEQQFEQQSVKELLDAVKLEIDSEKDNRRRARNKRKAERRKRSGKR